MADAYKVVIGGELADAASGETFDSIDPSTGETFATVAKGGAEDVRRAVEAARKAFDEGPWPKMRGRDRAAALLKVADLVKQNAGALAELEAKDAGHTIRMAKGADIGMVISTFRVFAEIAAKENDELPLTRNPGSTNWVRYEPIGVCVGITPWNFPIQMAAWKIAPAIAAGNSVIIKPASYTPLTTLEIGRLCLEAGIPEGVVNVLSGGGGDVGEALVQSPLVDKVAFTGSTEVGSRIMQLAGGTIKKCTLELGGKSASIVLDDVDMDYAIDGALWGVFFHNGQVCSAGTRLLVQRSIMDEFVAELAKRAEAIKIGPALDPASDAGPIVSKTQLEAVEGYVGIGREEGADVLVGGERAVVEGHDGGFYFQPTIFGNVGNRMRIAQEEIFGPVISAIPFTDIDEVIQRGNATSFGLGSGVWTKDVSKAHKMARSIRAGSVWVNCYQAMDPAVPFGGYKMSGYGRESGLQHVEEYLNVKAVWIKTA
jgi:aldehyde dehydrogenase (NAD+)